MGHVSDGARVTRRDVLGGAAVAGAGLLLGPIAARAAAGGLVFTRELGTLTAGTTRVVAPGRPFTLAGLRWTAPDRPHIELRTRRAGGPWGPWAPASVQGHDGDDVRDAGHAGEGVWTGVAAELALRCDETVRGVSVQFVADDATTAPRSSGAVAAVTAAGVAAAPALATPVLPAGPGQPPIVARRVWAGTDHRPTHAPQYGTIELAFVHHTEGPNGYSPGDVPGMLRSIYEFHVHGRGWWDIGYNFLVDHFGRIWEGREGGIDQPVTGAQAGDWNQLSTGVAMLGTFVDAPPAPAALAALERLLAWKLALHGVPALGRVAVVVDPAGAAYTQFRVGEHIHLPRIAGHRDGDATDCPGDALYHRLGEVRPRVARLAGPLARLTLAAELDELATGPVLVLGGRLTRGAGAPIAGAPIEIQAVGETAPLATATTAADGGWTATLTPRRSVLLRALHGPRPTVVSDLVAVERAPHGSGGGGGGGSGAQASRSITSASSTAPAGAAPARRRALRSRSGPG